MTVMWAPRQRLLFGLPRHLLDPLCQHRLIRRRAKPLQKIHEPRVVADQDARLFFLDAGDEFAGRAQARAHHDNSARTNPSRSDPNGIPRTRFVPLLIIRVGFAKSWRLPVYPGERTSSPLVGMSQRCQMRKSYLVPN